MGIRDFKFWSNAQSCAGFLSYPDTFDDSFGIAFKVQGPLVQ
jgi:hypothetical protein